MAIAVRLSPGHTLSDGKGDRMKTHLLLAAAALAAATAAVPAHALINAPVPEDNYISFGGLDWAWAAPCAAYGDSCGVVDMTYQSTQGWRFPTYDEFLARPTVFDFGTADSFKCASAWFSTVHSHCDYGDPDYPNSPVAGVQPSGYLFDYGYGITSNGSDPLAETWVVRGQATPGIPEPATWAMMIAGFGMVGAGLRRRRHAIA